MRHLRTAQHQISEGQPETVEHLKPELGAHRQARDVMRQEIVIHTLHVLTQLSRKDMDLRAGSQGHQQIVERSVKAEAGMERALVGRGQLQQAGMPFQIGTQTLMLNHHALGLSGRPRRVNHVGQP